MTRKLRGALGGAALLATAIPAPAPAQQPARHPISFESFIALKSVGDAQLSPDGRTVAFSVSTPSLQDNRNLSRIWVVPVGGGPARALTAGPGSDLSPRWTPDGSALAFISTRGGSPQVWRIPVAGGDAVQLTRLESGVGSFFWAPDGKALYLTSDRKWPESGQEIDRRNGEYPTQAKIWDELFYRHWDEWRAGTRSHLLRWDLAAGTARDLTPFDRDVPTLALGGADIAVAPGGTEVAVVYNPDQDVAQSTNNDVFVIPAGGGTPEPVTTRRGNDHSPGFSPDGRQVAYLSMATPGFESDQQQLWLYDRGSRQHQALTGDWDRNVQSFAWTPDGRAIVLELEEEGYHNLYRLDLASRKRTLLVSGGVNTGIQVSADGRTVVYLHQDATMPPEVYRVGLDGTGKRAVTAVNAEALAGLDLAPLESHRFPGALGDSVQMWLLKPPAFNPARKYPVFYVVHGGPQVPMLDSWSARWNYQMFAARGYMVAVVNFHGSPGWGQAFTNSISKHWGDYPFEDLMKGLDLVAALPYVDSTRMGAAGASYGGYMVNWMQGHTNRFKAMVSHDGIFNLAAAQGATEELWFPNHEFGEGGVTNPVTRAMLERWSPHNHADKWQTPMLVVHGEQDFRLDAAEGLQAFTALKVKGVPAKFLYFPDEGHWVLKPRNRRLWWSTVMDWMDQYLRPESRTGTP